MRWATTVTGDTTRYVPPTSGKMDVGWAAGEPPPAQHVNWLFNIIGLWIAYLNGLYSEAITWTGAHIFGSTASFPGGIIGGPTFTVAPTSPDYHVSVSRSMMIHPAAGVPDNPANWVVGTFALGGAPAIGYCMSFPTESGEIVTVTAYLSQATAVAGGTVQLSRVDPTTGTVTSVANVAIPTATGIQTIPVVTSHSVVTGAVYCVNINYGTGGGVKNLFGVKKAWIR